MDEYKKWCFYSSKDFVNLLFKLSEDKRFFLGNILAIIPLAELLPSKFTLSDEMLRDRVQMELNTILPKIPVSKEEPVVVESVDKLLQRAKELGIEVVYDKSGIHVDLPKLGNKASDSQIESDGQKLAKALNGQYSIDVITGQPVIIILKGDTHELDKEIKKEDAPTPEQYFSLADSYDAWPLLFDKDKLQAFLSMPDLVKKHELFYKKYLDYVEINNSFNFYDPNEINNIKKSIINEENVGIKSRDLLGAKNINK